MNLFGNFQFLCSAALRFEFPSRSVVAHERKGVSIRIFKTRFHSTPSLRLGWTTKLDPALRPLLKIRYDILGTGLKVDRAFAPHLTVKRGAVFTPDFGPRPWGWWPDRALPAGAPAGGCC